MHPRAEHAVPEPNCALTGRAMSRVLPGARAGRNPSGSCATGLHAGSGEGAAHARGLRAMPRRQPEPHPRASQMPNESHPSARCRSRSHRHLAEQPPGLDPRAGGVGKGVMAAGRSFRRSRALSAPALAAPTSNLKIFLFHIKGIIYKRESGYYPLITGSVPVTPSNPCAVSRLAINAIGALYLGSSIVTN